MQISISNGGIPKLPISCAVISALGIAGDRHAYRLHGGFDKALLLMAAELIDTLAHEGFDVRYGALGENVTTSGLDHLDFRPGQAFKVGGAIIQLTEPRKPCRKLTCCGRGIQKRILHLNGESGYYARVLESGIVVPKDIILRADPVVPHARNPITG